MPVTTEFEYVKPKDMDEALHVFSLYRDKARALAGGTDLVVRLKENLSCLALAVEADGSEIVTLEGANSRKWTQKLQKTFHAKNAFQCGFCAPGVILSATELLEKNSKPTAHDIKESIAGNLCRCTGYEPIVAAIAETAKGES